MSYLDKIKVVIPTYNEEKNIKEIIKNIKKFTKKIIVVVAKDTSDKTAEIAKKNGCKVIYDHGKGKGEAIKTAIDYINKKDIIVFIDADGSHEAKDIPKLVKPIIEDKSDMVIASRMLGGSDELHGTFVNWFKGVSTGFIQLIINWRFNVRLTDSENGFRAIKGNIAKNLKLKANDFDIEQEMVMKTLKKKYRISEISSHEYERKFGKPKLKLLKCGWKFIWRLIINLI